MRKLLGIGLAFIVLSIGSGSRAVIVSPANPAGPGGGRGLGPELVSNGEFDANINGWNDLNASFNTFEWDAGDSSLHAVETASEVSIVVSDDNIAIVSGSNYRCTVDIVVNSGAGMGIDIRDTGAGTQRNSLAAAGSAGTGSQSYDFVGDTTENVVIRFRVGSASDFNLDNISIRQIL